MAPDLGLRPKALHGVVEHLEHELRVDDVIHHAASREQVNLRLFHLNDLASGIGKIVQFFVEGVADGHDARRQVFVMAVLNGEGHQFGRDCAELHGLRSHALRGLEQLGILQLAPAHRSDDLGHHTRFEIIVKDVSSRKCDAARAGARELWNVAIESRHMVGRIAGPALTADILVEPAIPVGHDIQTRQFLFFHVHGQSVRVLLTKARVYHRFQKGPVTEIFGVPAGSRKRSGNRGREHFSCSGLQHFLCSPTRLSLFFLKPQIVQRLPSRKRRESSRRSEWGMRDRRKRLWRMPPARIGSHPAWRPPTFQRALWSAETCRRRTAWCAALRMMRPRHASCLPGEPIPSCRKPEN